MAEEVKKHKGKIGPHQVYSKRGFQGFIRNGDCQRLGRYMLTHGGFRKGEYDGEGGVYPDIHNPQNATQEFHLKVVEGIWDYPNNSVTDWTHFDNRTPNITVAEKQVDKIVDKVMGNLGPAITFTSREGPFLIGSKHNKQDKVAILVKSCGYGVSVHWPRFIHELQLGVEYHGFEGTAYLLQYRRLKSVEVALFEMTGEGLTDDQLFQLPYDYQEYEQRDDNDKKGFVAEGRPNFESSRCPYCPAAAEGFCKPPTTEIELE